MCTVGTFIKFNQQKVSLFSFRHLIKRTKTEINELHITSNCQDFNNSLAGTFCVMLDKHMGYQFEILAHI